MTPKRLKIIIPVIITVIGVGFSLFIFSRGEEEKFQLVPKQRPTRETGGEVTVTEVGTGWSIKESPEEAVREAVKMALEGKENKSPDFAAVFASSGTDLQAILLEARKLLGNETKIYGGTSDSRAVMTDKGFVKVSKTGYDYAAMEGNRGLAIMTVTSKDIIFGVRSANFSLYPSVQEASKAAILSAIKSAGKPRNELPTVILITPTVGVEHLRNKRFQLLCCFLRLPPMLSLAKYSSGNRRKLILNNLLSCVEIKDEKLVFSNIDLNGFVPVFLRQLIAACFY